MATRNYVMKHQVKQCKKCGADIAWTQNRNGKWFPVTLIYDARGAGPTSLFYESGIGNHRNLTPWHRCTVVDTPAPAAEPSAYQKLADEFAKTWFKLTAEGKIEEAAAYCEQMREPLEQAAAAEGLPPIEEKA